MSEPSRALPRVDLFGKSITRSYTIKAVQHNALNLSQGFPEADPVELVKDVAIRAIAEGANQYADMRGLPALRTALAERYRSQYAMPWVDADRHVSITCGATEAMAATILATAGPGDEVIIQEPTYENYPPQALIAGATVRYLRCEPPKWEITRDALNAAFNEKTRVIILNSPNNPTGHVITSEEMHLVSQFCERHDVIAVVDEIYEHLIWDGREHVRLASFDAMRHRTVTISGASKAYAVTGWRVGWAIAPERITAALQRIHDFMTATVPTPLQIGVVAALSLPPEYYSDQITAYERRRDLLRSYLDEAGLDYEMPEGAYYFFPSCQGLKVRDSEELAERLVVEAGVAVVPYTAFYRTPGLGKDRFRINFAKKESTLERAGKQLVEFCRNNRC